jgi:hypothetical protein
MYITNQIIWEINKKRNTKHLLCWEFVKILELLSVERLSPRSLKIDCTTQQHSIVGCRPRGRAPAGGGAATGLGGVAARCAQEGEAVRREGWGRAARRASRRGRAARSTEARRLIDNATCSNHDDGRLVFLVGWFNWVASWQRCRLLGWGSWATGGADCWPRGVYKGPICENYFFTFPPLFYKNIWYGKKLQNYTSSVVGTATGTYRRGPRCWVQSVFKIF